MPFLHTLRHRSIVRWMLLSFVVALGAAVASPLLHPQGMSLVCSANGAVRWVADGDIRRADTALPDAQGSTERAAQADALGADVAQAAPVDAPASLHALDCVLCLPVAAPGGDAPALALAPAQHAAPLPAAVATLRQPLLLLPQARGPPAAA